MPEYELVTILSPILSQEEVTNTWDRLNAVITADGGGTVTYQERWGTRRLAYPIRKAGNRFLEGNYHLTRFETDGTRMSQIEGHLRLSENIIRHLLVKAELPIGASPRPTEPPPRGEDLGVRPPAAPPPAAVAEAPAEAPPGSAPESPVAEAVDETAPAVVAEAPAETPSVADAQAPVATAPEEATAAAAMAEAPPDEASQEAVEEASPDVADGTPADQAIAEDTAPVVADSEPEPVVAAMDEEPAAASLGAEDLPGTGVQEDTSDGADEAERDL